MSTTTEKKPAPKSKAKSKDKSRYIEAIGRRKAATARVRIYPSTNKPLKDVAKKDDDRPHLTDPQKLDFTVNEKSLGEYFPTSRLSQTALAPLNILNVTFTTTVKVRGGGVAAQAEAIRLGLSRALNDLNEKWRPRLKSSGFLTVDARKVERKHPGLRKARRPQQWRKR